MPAPRGRRKKAPEADPIIKETYRGEKIEAVYGKLGEARAAVDRIWAMKIAQAPNRAAREAVLAEERALPRSRLERQKIRGWP